MFVPSVEVLTSQRCFAHEFHGIILGCTFWLTCTTRVLNRTAPEIDQDVFLCYDKECVLAGGLSFAFATTPHGLGF